MAFRIQKFTLLLILILTLGMFSVIPAAQAMSDDSLIVRQQLFTVRPTLDIDDLERYSNNGILSSRFVTVGLPILVLGAMIAVGYFYISTRGKETDSKKKQKKIIKYAVGGSLNAAALFLAFTLVSGVLAPGSLQNLAVYVDDQQRFAYGDQLRTTFQVTNVGNEDMFNLSFVNEYSNDLELEEGSILVERTGELPEDYLPLTVPGKVMINIGTLHPGESANVNYDFAVANRAKSDIINFAEVRDGSGNTVHSNTVIIRRGYDSEVEAINLPPPGTELIKDSETATIYYVAPGELLRPISETNVQRIYGDGWEFDVTNVTSAGLRGIALGPVIEGTEYPDALYLTDGESRCYIEEARCRPLTEAGIQKLGLTDHHLRIVSNEIIHSFPLGELIDG